jgi:hypothetical protein
VATVFEVPTTEDVKTRKPRKPRNQPVAVEEIETTEIKIPVPVDLQDTIKQYQRQRGEIETSKKVQKAISKASEVYVDTLTKVFEGDEEFQAILKK